MRLGAVLVLAGGLLSGCGERGPRGLILVTIDTCRADRIGCYGAGFCETPAIDGLAERGTVFLQATAPAPLTLPLILDTGASMVVLPSSMMAQLGFRAAELQVARMQTANKTVEGRVGVLRSVTVGGMAASDVRVAFVDDGLLNGAMLLGMSYLEHFRITIDDKNDQILLTRTR